MKENRLFTYCYSEVKYMLFDRKHDHAPAGRNARVKRAARREARRNSRIILANEMGALS